MKMKSEIDIVTGFLGSGKTFFINTFLKNTLVPNETVLIVQCEEGQQKINTNLNVKSKIIVKEYDPSKALTTAYLKQMIEFYNPHRVIIEHNGMRLLSEVLSLFNEDELLKLCCDPVIYHTTDALTFDIFYNNMKELVEPLIVYSNLMILSNCNMLEKEKLKALKEKLKVLNTNGFIFALNDFGELEEALKRSDVLESSLIRNIRLAIKNIRFNKLNRRRLTSE
ncbi:hypothetical protein HMPREF1982_01972 [Clostridiales bacterium oral taxon 876 str. F0540]|nr:hypothetical protein HMPREF1982_01972 [Clostridiales bacterium oral taxon 876 str. F0540]